MYFCDKDKYICGKHFVNIGPANTNIKFKGTIIDDCSFNGFRFDAGSFKGCIIKRCRFYNCTLDKNAFIGCTITGTENYLFGCYVISNFTDDNETFSRNDVMYTSLRSLMVGLNNGFKSCRYLQYLDWSIVEHKRFYTNGFESRLVRYSRIKDAKLMKYSIFVNCTFYKCDFIKQSPVGCSFINCTFSDCPFDTDSFRSCILYECEGGYDTTYEIV